jgi:hypothetical protein
LVFLFQQRNVAAASPLAIVAELADAHGSGPCTGNGVGVRVPSMAPGSRLDNPSGMK